MDALINRLREVKREFKEVLLLPSNDVELDQAYLVRDSMDSNIIQS